MPECPLSEGDNVEVYDLSVPIKDGTDWYNDPLTPPVKIEDIGGIEKEGWVSQTLTIQVLNGCTYIETSAHLFKDGPTLDKVPPEKFLCRAHIIRLASDQQELPAPERGISEFGSGKDALLLYCGWDSHINQSDFYGASPYFAKPLQQMILDLNPSILGGDMVSFDHPDDASMPFLHTFFERGGMILCPLIGLGEIPRDVVTLCAAPLMLVGANASPCRALAWL